MTAGRTLEPRDWVAQPAQAHPSYKSTLLRSQQRKLVPLPQSASELTAPVFGPGAVDDADCDLTRNAVRSAEPLGERILVSGRVLDGSGRPLRGTLVEVWQANAAGR